MTSTTWRRFCRAAIIAAGLCALGAWFWWPLSLGAVGAALAARWMRRRFQQALRLEMKTVRFMITGLVRRDVQ